MLLTAPDTIAIAPMRRLDEVIALTGAKRVISIVNAHLMPPTPAGILAIDHLKLPISDARPDRGAANNPSMELMGQLIASVRAWPQDSPLLIHCFSGLNRSTAAAYVALAALNPTVPEALIAYRLRATSETAAPNRNMVGLADILLKRRGNLLSAVELIGSGLPAAEGEPFSLPVSFGP
ncbi:MAG: tyrosine protein phosphatase [Hyphomicrobiaceae bacterium]|nr:tyrosine protein phosphatase [Hyphomicrobiaceae bacterium]